MLRGWVGRVRGSSLLIHHRNVTVALRCPIPLYQVTCRTYSDVVPLRKQLKDDAREVRKVRLALPQKAQEDKQSQNDLGELAKEYELTVGIEIHAQLNTPRKLFSPALTAPTDTPNHHVAAFDLALPGSQPILQFPVLVPAIRAALAVGCTIQPSSQFDRKHYFYHDQPSGYQITQYYHPFARDGQVTLTSDDGLAAKEELVVGIKQVQLEQDTARTQEQDHDTNLIDFNRAGHPLIEIISLPHIHSPVAAGAYVRRIQALLFSVDAVTTGMEMGGLRADVNVSVRRFDSIADGFSYGGVTGLGQRVEIKNLSSFRGVEDAVRAEMYRQIETLQNGGTVEGETRGWSVTNPGATRRLRGKEGEVDYRYMPDPDIPPLYIAEDVIHHLKSTLPPTPQRLQQMLQADYGLSHADAVSLLALDGGRRLIYFQDVVDRVIALHNMKHPTAPRNRFGTTVANWLLHILGALLSTRSKNWSPDIVPARSMATIIHLCEERKLTNTSGKKVLRMVFEGNRNPVERIVEREGLLFSAMPDHEYRSLALNVMNSFPSHVEDIRDRGKVGKINFLVGQMMQRGQGGNIQASDAEAVLRSLILKKG